MKKTNYVGIVLGLLFLAIGLGYLLEVIGVFENFTIFFSGWWTLFIIVPCFCGLISRGGGEKIGYLIGLAIGVFLLLVKQDVLDGGKAWGLLIAAAFVLFGLGCLLPKNNRLFHSNRREDDNTDRFDRHQNRYSEHSAAGNSTGNGVIIEGDAIEKDNSTDGEQNRYSEQETTGQSNTQQTGSTNSEDFVVCSAVFSGRDIHVDNSNFTGADLSALFGGIDINLKNAIIKQNVTIDVRAVFGGIDILIPPNVRVVVDVTPILGGVDNGARTPLGADESTPTVFVKGTCMFGGVEIK